ncbi:hypothetical protein Tco_1190144 [Tanacetum coccineum]
MAVRIYPKRTLMCFLAQPNAPFRGDNKPNAPRGDGGVMVMRGMVMMMTVVAGYGCRRGWRRVTASGYGDQVSNDSICSKSCLETIELLKSQNDQLLKDLKKYELMVLGYKTCLESVEEKLEVYKENESIYLQDIKGLKFEIHIGEITIKELRKKLEIVQKEKDGIQLNVDKFEHASKSLNKLIECQIVDNCKKGLGYENYNAVPPPYTGNFMSPTPDLSFTGLDEFVNEPVVKNCKAMSSEEEPKVVRKYDVALSIKEWVSDDEEEDVS